MQLNELSAGLKDWLSENDYHEPEFIRGVGWYAFKGSDVIPTPIQEYIMDMWYNKQQLYPRVDLTEENL
jgi:hypothetical protein